LQIVHFTSLATFALLAANMVADDAPTTTAWHYAPELLQPIWQGDTMRGESVLFTKDDDGQPHASVLFPIEQVLAVKNSVGDTTYEEGRDFTWNKNSREIRLTPNSRITFSKPTDLLKPANTQQFHLQHRNGQGDIYFGAKLEYQNLQTCVTYKHAATAWKADVPKRNEQSLPKTLAKLRGGEPLRVLIIGDSISTGCNASGWAGGPPFQPAYPELVKSALEHNYAGKVSLTNVSVGGMATPWMLTMLEKVIAEKPDLVIIAFGMNDAAGRTAAEYRANTRDAITKVKSQLPDAEFILVATMVGNQDWIALKQELFPAYRDALHELCGPGIALADVTSVWSELLKVKNHYDLTGNGVNHPNDFGHRIYAQVICSLLVPLSTDNTNAAP